MSPLVRRIAASVTCWVRHCVRSMRCHSPSLRSTAFPPPSPPPVLSGFVRGFIGTMQSSDPSLLPQWLRLNDFPSWSRIATATVDKMRSPKFRHVPFLRNGFPNPGRAVVPRMAVHNMLPSTYLAVWASAMFTLRGQLLHSTRSLCTLRSHRHRGPRNTRYRAARYGLTLAELSSAGTRQLRLAH